ncbi:DoxX family protein [Mycobacterium sp. 21AC1]|uniref:DoxX family protein n=1 Tax=[Mycobacterium] appelbergii TaxID=2939269 RepID=UPI00293944A9|nr:DoxX family protein [Mycobacterium sp. 21AC1]MDV3129119.1 DoxX family protein [Mycobacterium sp. 21AC1]
MFTPYVILTLLTAGAAGAGCVMNYIHHPIPVAAAKAVQVPQSWMIPLGSLLGAGALGLLAGLAIPALGIAAATGLVLYFIGAIIAHLRVRDFALGPAAVFLTLTVATLVATLAYRLG